MARIAALTGATGFIGQELLRQLQDNGWHVRALTRRTLAPDDAPDSADANVTWIKGDLSSPAALHELVEGSDVVIHLAGAIKARNRADFFDANAVGVTAMIEATAARAANAHFILVSSLAAREPGLSHYAASKAAGEKAVTQATAAANWTILRPPAVYGPGDFEILKLLKSLKFGLGFTAGAGHSRLSMVHVRDLCAGIIATIGVQPAFGRLLHIDDGCEGGYTLGEILTVGAQILEKTPRLVRVPRLALISAAGLNQGLAKLTGGVPMLTLGKVRELCHDDWVCHGEMVWDYTDWRPDIKASAGLAETLAWYRDRGLI